jgi:hypothetical protein
MFKMPVQLVSDGCVCVCVCVCVSYTVMYRVVLSVLFWSACVATVRVCFFDSVVNSNQDVVWTEGVWPAG